MTLTRESAEQIIRSEWSDFLVDQRVTVLRQYADGWDNPAFGEMMRPQAFPNGFDPDLHPEDDLEFMVAEQERRAQG